MHLHLQLQKNIKKEKNESVRALSALKDQLLLESVKLTQSEEEVEVLKETLKNKESENNNLRREFVTRFLQSLVTYSLRLCWRTAEQVQYF